MLDVIGAIDLKDHSDKEFDATKGYPGEGPARFRNRASQELWGRYVRETTLNWFESTVCLDYHGVVDTMTEEQAIDVGVRLDHLDVNFGILSYGREHSLDTFVDPATGPIVAESHFIIFTDYRKSYDDVVEVYRPRDYPDKAIRVRGDKGCVRDMLNRRAFLFDDHEENIDQFREHGGDGAVVRLAWRRHARVPPGYDRIGDVYSIVPRCRVFAEEAVPPAIGVGGV